MAEPFLSELRLFSFSFAPKAWALCNGQFLPINQNQPLFSLLGTTYGGNGQTTFALPDLRERTPVHVGSSFALGTTGGEQDHTLSVAEMPTHNHVVTATKTDANTNPPSGNLLAGAANVYGPVAAQTTLLPDTVTNAGGSQPHPNMQPYLTLTWCIALQGIFPSPN